MEMGRGSFGVLQSGRGRCRLGQRRDRRLADSRSARLALRSRRSGSG